MAKLVVKTKTGATITYVGSESEIKKLAQLHSAQKSQIVEFAPDVQVNKYVTATGPSYTGSAAQQKALEPPPQPQPQRVEILASQVTAKDVEAMFEKGYVYAGQTGPMTHAWEKITEETKPTQVSVPATTTMPAVHYVTPEGERKEIVAKSVEESAKIAQELMKSGEAVATTLIDKEVPIKSETGAPQTMKMEVAVEKKGEEATAVLRAEPVSGYVEVTPLEKIKKEEPKIEEKIPEPTQQTQKTPGEALKELETKWIRDVTKTLAPEEEREKLAEKMIATLEEHEKKIQLELEKERKLTEQLKEEYKSMGAAEKAITTATIFGLRPEETIGAALTTFAPSEEEIKELQLSRLQATAVSEEAKDLVYPSLAKEFEKTTFEEKIATLYAQEKRKALKAEETGKIFEYFVETAPATLPGKVTLIYGIGAGFGALSAVSTTAAKAVPYVSSVMGGLYVASTAGEVMQYGFTDKVIGQLALLPAYATAGYVGFKQGFEAAKKYEVTFDFGKVKKAEKYEKGLIDVKEGTIQKAGETKVSYDDLIIKYKTKTPPKVSEESAPTDVLKIVSQESVKRTGAVTEASKKVMIQRGTEAEPEIYEKKIAAPGGKELIGRYTTYTKADRVKAYELYASEKPPTEESFLSPLKIKGSKRKVLAELQKLYAEQQKKEAALKEMEAYLKETEAALKGQQNVGVTTQTAGAATKQLYVTPKVTISQPTQPQYVPSPIATPTAQATEQKTTEKVAVKTQEVTATKLVSKTIENAKTMLQSIVQNVEKKISGLMAVKKIEEKETEKTATPATHIQNVLERIRAESAQVSTQRELGREMSREISRNVERNVERFGESLLDRLSQIENRAERQIENQLQRQQERQIQRQIERQLTRQIERQTEKQIEKKTKTETTKITTPTIIIPKLITLPSIYRATTKKLLPSAKLVVKRESVKRTDAMKAIKVSPIMGSVSMFLYGKASPPKITEQVKKKAHLYVPTRELQEKKKSKSPFAKLFNNR